ncbi:MAG: 30S ribosomal protein S4 [Bacteroidia bacterium]|nr:30S ribosomal protein S4 [Bacteroidia bacterium]
MSRYTGPKSRIARRFKDHILGFSKALERKNYPPGVHGKTRRAKKSEYSLQLNEKQKAKYIYGVQERQFRNTFFEATRRKGVTGEILIQLLESRLDNTVYRLGFAATRRQARQLVSHTHITVNDRVVNIPSYRLRPGDVITVREKSKSLEVVTGSLTSAKENRYSWLTLDKSLCSGKFLHLPLRSDVPEDIREQLIVELYSR